MKNFIIYKQKRKKILFLKQKTKKTFRKNNFRKKYLQKKISLLLCGGTQGDTPGGHHPPRDPPGGHPPGGSILGVPNWFEKGGSKMGGFWGSKLVGFGWLEKGGFPGGLIGI